MYDAADRIVTTHIGSLPRPPELLEWIKRRERGESVSETERHELVQSATKDVIERQQAAGLDVINDGEQGRVAFNFYVQNRLSGLGGEAAFSTFADLDDYPEYAEAAITSALDFQTTPSFTGPIEYTDTAPLDTEIDTFRQCLTPTDGDSKETFITAASPGTIAYTFGNDYYDSYEELVFAIAEAMQTEYERIAETDAHLQLDAPDLLMGAHHTWKDASRAEFRDIVRLHIDAINEATASIPDDRIRLHTCWGNYEGPHHHDLPLEAVLPDLYEASVGILSIEQASPRHAHEYAAYAEVPPPEELVIMPGVVNTKSNYIEHPELVAERLERVADAIGDPTRVAAAPDCGFDTFADLGRVDPDIVWAKLEALVEGAALASDRLL